MKQMQKLFTDGGKIIWVAPSGGRDRQGADGEFEVAPFDSKSIEMFRLMADKACRRQPKRGPWRLHGSLSLSL